MGVLDFLFDGRPPASTTTYGETVENIPQWLSDYNQGLIGRANMAAGEPYQAYEGPRIAGFSPDQLAGFESARGNVESWQPGIGRAGELYDEAGNKDLTGVADPYLQGAAGNFAGTGSLNPLNQAAPFLQQGVRGFPASVNEYMDPYIGNVLNRQAELSNRNLVENSLPALQDAFVGSGSFGGDRMMDLGVRTIRDTSEALQSQQLGALSAAYGQAGNLYGADAGRWMEGANLAGNLTTAQGQLGLGAGTGLLNVGRNYGDLTGAEGDLALRAGEGYGALGEATSEMGWRDAAGLEAIGAQQRGLDQQSLDLAYSDFEEQRDFPRDSVDWMSQIIHGMPPQGGTVSTSSTGPANVYGPSPLAQLASGYSIWKGLQSDEEGD